jgi:hypothetical protein
MSTIDSALARGFHERLREYGKKAIAYKFWFQASWFLITLSVWATLLLAIVGLAWPDMGWLGTALLEWVIPFLGILVTLGTILQFLLRLQTKWTSYRHAAEHLKSAFMKHRAGLLTVDQFRNVMEQIKQWAGQGKKIQGSYLYSFFGLPLDLRHEFPDIADVGPSNSTGGSDSAAKPFNIPTVIAGRLQNQRQWMIRKMKKNRLVYIAFQLAIIMISLGNAWYVWTFGRQFGWVAGTTALSLAIIACRDFLDLDRLILQYLDTAYGLAAIKQEFEGVDPNDQARLCDLVQRVEYLLEHEAEAWYHQHAGPVAIQSACIPRSTS